MQTWYALLQQDISAAHERLTIQDFALLFQILYWFILLFFPLSGIDKRDQLTALSYILFLLFSGCLLVFAIPGRAIEFADWHHHLLVFFILSLIAWWRWHYRRKDWVKAAQNQKKLDNTITKKSGG